MTNPKYVVVRAYSPDELQEIVNNNIEVGYMVMGGVSVAGNEDDGFYFCQAMVRSTGYGV